MVNETVAKLDAARPKPGSPLQCRQKWTSLRHDRRSDDQNNQLASGTGAKLWVVAFGIGDVYGLVTLYCGLGFGFAGNIQAAGEMAGSVLGIVAGLAVMLGLGWWLVADLWADRPPT